MQRMAWAALLLLAAPLLSGCLGTLESPEPAQETPAPPTFRLAWAPEDPRAGETISFEVVPDDPSDPITDAAWNFGDGTGMNAITPDKSYRNAGWYAVSVALVTLGGHQTTLRMDFPVRAQDGSMPGASTHPTRSSPSSPGTSDAGENVPPLPPPALRTQLDENRLSAWFDWNRTPTRVEWDFGDGTTSTTSEVQHQYLSQGEFTVHLTVWDGDRLAANQTQVEVLSVPFVPHVIVGIPDTGINPYHEMFYRPGLTEHPCTYIQDFPCDIPALELSVGPDHGSWEDRFQADEGVWDSIRKDTWYWIPQTIFVGVYCDSGETRAEYRGSYCILDDAHMHGTGTVSSALMENPDALFAFKDGGSGIGPILESGIPVDLVSVSWGSIVPIPALGYSPTRPLFITSAGNDPRSTLIDSKGDPDIISVGGAYAQDDTQEVLAAWHPEVVSYFCRPTAQTRSLDEMRPSYCGTSFSSPTVAGALSKVILEIRRDSGYTGSISAGMVDPVHGISKQDLRNAMNRTASYDPTPQYPNSCIYCYPLNPAAPWLQWGWGFYDGLVAQQTIAYLQGEKVPDKPAEAYTYMETMHLLKQATHPV